MSTVKTTNLQHPSAASPNLVLNADGSVTGIGLVAVKHALFTGTQSNSTAAGANFAVTDLSITHALADASNKLIISAYFGAAYTGTQDGRVGIGIYNGTTLIGVGDAAGSRTQVAAGGRTDATGSTISVTMPSITFVYAPGDTSSRTFTVRAINIDSGTQTIAINRTGADTDNATSPRASSGFVIQEVKV